MKCVYLEAYGWSLQKTNGVPVPHCKKVMMIVSSTVYDFLLDHVARFQQKIVQPETVTTETDEDGVYYHFGGTTLYSIYSVACIIQGDKMLFR